MGHETPLLGQRPEEENAKNDTDTIQCLWLGLVAGGWRVTLSRRDRNAARGCRSVWLGVFIGVYRCVSNSG